MASAVVASATYPADTTAYEWLVNDWDTDSDLWINVQGTYTVSLQTQGFYGVQLRHVAESLDGNLKSIAVIPSAGGVELEQVSSLVAPSAGQYRMSPLPTGRLEFSSASNGTEYIIKYVSSGTVNRRRTGDYIYGYMDDGTALYAKELSFTITAGDNLEEVSHGITDAYTDSRIVDIRARCNNGSTTFLTAEYGDAGEVAENINNHAYTDSVIQFYRSNTAATRSYVALVVYKEA